MDYSVAKPSLTQASAELQAWVASQLSESGSINISTVGADAGFRVYYRVRTGTDSYIAAHSPPQLERNQDFVARGRALRAAGINVPTIHAYDFDQGFLLLQDFGDVHLSQFLAQFLEGNPLSQSNSLKQLATAKSLESMAAISNCTPSELGSSMLDSFDNERIDRELRLCQQWFSEGLLNSTDAIPIPYGAIANELSDIPKVPTHFDYHVRNLMVTGSKASELAIGILDFQDLAYAPLGLDLVSMTKDCYHLLDNEQRQSYIFEYHQHLHLGQPININDLKHWMDLCGLQRHLRILGVFSRIYIRDGRSTHTAYIPLVCDYIRQLDSAELPLVRDIQLWLADVQPALQQRLDSI